MSKNKIFAVTFLALACCFFFGHYLFLEIDCSWTYFRSASWPDIIAFVLDAMVYLILLSCNIRNDDFAYTGIALFVSMKFIGYIRVFMYSQVNLLNALYSGSALSVLLSLFYLSFLAGEVAVGVCLYIFMVRYQRGSPRFVIVRVFAILFAAILTLTGLFYCLLYLQSIAFSWRTLFTWLALPLAEACAGVGIIFTLERLRRC